MSDIVMSGAEFLVRQMNEIRTGNGDVIRMMRQLEGNHWDMVAMTGIDQVQKNLERFRLEMERRTNLLATGLTTAVAGIEQLRDAALQSSQAHGKASQACRSLNEHMSEMTESVRHLVRKVEDLEGQVFLQEAMSQQMNELRDRVTALESRGLASGEWPEVERDAFLRQHKLQSDKFGLRIHDLQEAVRKLESRASRSVEEEHGRSTELASVMERVVETERICKQLRARDEEIQGHLSHILSREPKPDASAPTQAHEGQTRGLSEVQTYHMASGTPLQEIIEDEKDQWWDDYDEKPITDWYRHPPGLDHGTWAPSAPPPALPREFVRSETSSAAGRTLQLESKDLRIQGGQWKLLKEFPRIQEPKGQAWEKGLQFAQYATEMVSVASCVGVGFARYVRFQIDRALERFQTRMDKGVSDWDLMPTTPAGCD